MRARVEQGVREQALTVPQRALVRTAPGRRHGLGGGGRQQGQTPRPVEVGVSAGDAAVIASGLEAGDKVVVEGLQKIRPGAEVRIAQPAPALVAPAAPAPAPAKP